MDPTKERVYIVATDLRAIRIATEILRSLHRVSDEERREVLRLLRQWEAALEQELPGLLG